MQKICIVIGHFKIKCPRARRPGGGDSGSRGDKGSTDADGGRTNTRSRRGDGRDGRSQETKLVADGNHSKELTRPVKHSAEFAFFVEQLTCHKRKSSDLITLIVGGVAVSDVLIDSGATCNVMDQQIMLKLKGIICESRKSSEELFVFGGTEPLPTLGIFTADVMLPVNNSGCRADFVVVTGEDWTLLDQAHWSLPSEQF